MFPQFDFDTGYRVQWCYDVMQKCVAQHFYEQEEQSSLLLGGHQSLVLAISYRRLQLKALGDGNLSVLQHIGQLAHFRLSMHMWGSMIYHVQKRLECWCCQIGWGGDHTIDWMKNWWYTDIAGSRVSPGTSYHYLLLQCWEDVGGCCQVGDLASCGLQGKPCWWWEANSKAEPLGWGRSN